MTKKQSCPTFKSTSICLEKQINTKSKSIKQPHKSRNNGCFHQQRANYNGQTTRVLHYKTITKVQPQSAIDLNYIQIKFISYLIKHININLLKTVRTAELIDLVMDLVINPCVIIVHTIVEERVIHIIFPKPVNNLMKGILMNKCQLHKIETS